MNWCNAHYKLSNCQLHPDHCICLSVVSQANQLPAIKSLFAVSSFPMQFLITCLEFILTKLQGNLMNFLGGVLKSLKSYVKKEKNSKWLTSFWAKRIQANKREYVWHGVGNVLNKNCQYQTNFVASTEINLFRIVMGHYGVSKCKWTNINKMLPNFCSNWWVYQISGDSVHSKDLK